MDHTNIDCLNWKEILSQIDDNHQVNLFLVENNTLIFENYILSKSLYYYLSRFDIYQTSASGNRGRKAKATKKQNSTANMKNELIHVHICAIHIMHAKAQPCVVTRKCLLCIHVMDVSKEKCVLELCNCYLS
jgi:hypothetical protein